MRNLLLLLFAFVSVTVFSQDEQVLKKPSEVLTDYFNLPRETVYLHLNKSSYVEGENLWFKGYVFNTKEGTPFKETTNVYVGLYDKDGKQIDKRMFLAKDGYVQGNFEIDSTISKGDFYIKAATNWMRNFKENLAHVQKLELVSPDVQQDFPIDVELDYDVQFLPEGGHMVNNISNTIGVKVLKNDGYGTEIANGVVLDDSGKIVTEFFTNKFGHGKFSLTPKMGATYKAVVRFLDGQKLNVKLPMSQNKGIIMELRYSSYHDKVPVYIKTNQETIKSEGDLAYYALVHQNDKSIRFDFELSPSSPETGFFIAKKDIPLGVNTITVFNKNDQPLLERLIFNSYQLKSSELQLQVEKDNAPDSVLIRLNMTGNSNEFTNLSASVLPEDTKAYNHPENIYSAFYLKPYLKGYVENGGYYFENMSSKRESELDLLLLNQGWTSYKWDTFYKNPPKKRFDFEKGVTLSVAVNDLMEDDKTFYIFPTKNHLEKAFTLSKDKQNFNVNNFFLERDENLFISEKNQKDGFKSPKLYVTTRYAYRTDNIAPRKGTIRRQSDIIDKTISKLVLKENIIALDEVVVSRNKLLKKAKSNVNVPPLLKRRIEPIDDKVATDFPYIIDFIASKGYRVNNNMLSFDQPITSTRGGQVAIYLDGQSIPDFQILANIKTEQIESYFFDRNQFVASLANGGTETLYLYRRLSNNLLDSQKKRYGSVAIGYPISNGFEPTKKFYNPKYNTYFSKNFEQYGAIHWEPEILLRDGKASFKMIDTGLENIAVYITGMNSDGQLFYFKKSLPLDDF